MLFNLDIKNIAVIEDLTFEPGEKMSVLTGETGAGKSVIIDSVNLILGARTNKNLIRYGCEKARVSAMFSLNAEVLKVLEENGIETEDDCLLISREITVDGKSIARVNGNMVSVGVLKNLAVHLVDIHGQHDNQSLLTPSKHINFLDSYAQNSVELTEYQELYNELRRLKNEYSELTKNEQDRVYKIDLLKYQTGEIEKANLKAGEKEELTEQHLLISNAEKISRGINLAYSNLYDSEKNVNDLMSKVLTDLSEISEYDNQISDFKARLEGAYYEIEDISHELKNYSNRIDFDEQRLEEIEQRLDLIKKLEKKYGGSIENCLEFYEKSKNELDLLENSDVRCDELLKEIDKLNEKISIAAKKLSDKRKKAAKELSENIEKHLHELEMEKASFLVEVTECEEYRSNGLDKVIFLFSANPGQPPKELSEIASGGELSRVMLAIKSVLSESDEVETLIFDEIDTGVSGEAAQKIAIKLSRLAKCKQVICISHQPQLAAIGDNHFKIQKEIQDGVTKTKISKLDSEERINELARMIDGNNITNTSILHAKEMLERGC